MSQMQIASGSWKRQGNGLSLGAPEGMQPCRNLNFSPAKPFQTSNLKNWKVINLCCFKHICDTLLAPQVETNAFINLHLIYRDANLQPIQTEIYFQLSWIIKLELSLENRFILGLRQENYKMNPEHLTVSESKEVLKRGQGMSKGHRS